MTPRKSLLYREAVRELGLRNNVVGNTTAEKVEATALLQEGRFQDAIGVVESSLGLMKEKFSADTYDAVYLSMVAAEGYIQLMNLTQA